MVLSVERGGQLPRFIHFGSSDMGSTLLALLLVAGSSATVLAASCSDWKATCESRGGGSACEAKYDKCMKTGTFTEGAAFGGATHSGVTRK